MRIAPTLTIVAAMAALATAAAASDVRILSLPDNVHGAWAPSADACTASGEDRLDIAARTFSMPDQTCEIAWITVTAARDGPVYSARAMCTQARSGQKDPPSYLLVRPRPDKTLLVRRASADAESDPVTYRKC
jgi:hypothetical protein